MIGLFSLQRWVNELITPARARLVWLLYLSHSSSWAVSAALLVTVKPWRSNNLGVVLIFSFRGTWKLAYSWQRWWWFQSRKHRPCCWIKTPSRCWSRWVLRKNSMIAGLEIRGCKEPRDTLNSPAALSNFCREPEVVLFYIQNTFR